MNDVKEKIYFFFDSLLKIVFDTSVDFQVEEHKFIKNGYVILLPPKAENIGHIIGRQGRVINALNVLISSWAYKNNIVVYVKQKREEENN